MTKSDFVGSVKRGLVSAGYGVVTLHRPSNVDDAATLGPLLEVLRDLSERLPLVFALHPRTRNNVDRFGLAPVVDSPRIAMLPPQGYLEMLGLMGLSELPRAGLVGVTQHAQDRRAVQRSRCGWHPRSAPARLAPRPYRRARRPPRPGR